MKGQSTCISLQSVCPAAIPRHCTRPIPQYFQIPLGSYNAMSRVARIAKWLYRARACRMAELHALKREIASNSDQRLCSKCPIPVTLMPETECSCALAKTRSSRVRRTSMWRLGLCFFKNAVFPSRLLHMRWIRLRELDIAWSVSRQKDLLHPACLQMVLSCPVPKISGNPSCNYHHRTYIRLPG